MPDKLSFPGLLPAGFHIKTLEEIKALCVDNFPTSMTRPVIFDNFVRHMISPLVKMGMMCDVWIDGSFITEKENPEDVDILIEYDPTKNYQPQQIESIYTFLKMCVANHAFKCQCLCDAYAVPTNNQKSVAYWMGQFGFNRDRTPKGLAVIQINGGK